MNELAVILDNLVIDTSEELKATVTMQNFLKFSFRLVGENCDSQDIAGIQICIFYSKLIDLKT
jgi:hypothetical protein